MPEETQASPPAVQAEPVQSQSISNIIDDGDPSLDIALNKMFNREPTPDEKPPKPVEPPEPTKEKAPEVKVEDVQKQDKPDDSKDQIIDPDKIDNSPSKRQEGWTTLKNNLKRSNKIAEEAKQEVAKLKSLLSERGQTTNKEVEDLKKQVEELSAFRAMVDIQADPEFVSKYDAPIEKNIEGIDKMLEEMGVGPEVRKKIDYSNTKLMEDIINHVGEHKDKFTARKLERKVQDLLDLSEKRDETIIEHKSKHKEYLENKKKESFTKSAETEGRIIKRLESVAKNISFLNKMAAKEGATEAESLQIDKHNQMVDAMSQRVQQVLAMKTPEEEVDKAVAAVGAHFLNTQLQAANAKIASLQEEIKKISNVSSETDKTKPVNTPKRSSNGNGEVMDLDTALAERFGRRV